MNYYIITRQGGINEIPFTQESYLKAIETWQNGGVLAYKVVGSDTPKGTNASDIVEIMTQEDYERWRMSANPKRYIKNGSWYDDKHVLIKHEPWKQKEIDNRLKLQEVTTDKEQQKKIAELMRNAWSDKKPDTNNSNAK